MPLTAADTVQLLPRAMVWMERGIMMRKRGMMDSGKERINVEIAKEWGREREPERLYVSEKEGMSEREENMGMREREREREREKDEVRQRERERRARARERERERVCVCVCVRGESTGSVR